MKRVGSAAIAMLVVASLATGATVADDGPLADAGLDREVEVGTTVRLDATGSRVPGGTIAGYEWELEAPNGTTRHPACSTCQVTSVVPYRIGQYNVSVTVTAADGTSRSDTFHLTVESGTGPTVDQSGPTDPPVGGESTYTADLSSGSVPLDRVAWTLNGSEVERRQVSGGNVSVEYDHEFDDEDPRSLAVTVTDVAGQQANDTLTIEPTSRARRGGGGDRDFIRIDWGGRVLTADVPRRGSDGELQVPDGRPTEQDLLNVAADTTGSAETDFTSDEGDDESNVNPDSGGGEEPWE